MAHEIHGRYDTRGWGYAYGLHCLMRLKSHDLIPSDLAPTVESAVAFYLEGIKVSPEELAGQWDYLSQEVASAGERDQWQMTHPFPPLRMKAMMTFWPASRYATVARKKTIVKPAANRRNRMPIH